MKFERVPSPSRQSATHLWLMLPGAYMKPDDFIRAGFVDAIRARGLPHEIAMLHATLSEMVDGSALAFLQACLRGTAATPEQKVCVLGISLGAQLAMLCLSRAGSDAQQGEAAARVSHALVMAPYLGPRDLLAEVAAGSRPDDGAVIDNERQIWRWLQDASDKPQIYLGYGTEDRFADAHALMARTLPANRVDTVPGGHDWPVWTALWNRHLALFHGR